MWEPEGKGHIGRDMKFKGQGCGEPKAKGCELPDVFLSLAARHGKAWSKREGRDSVIGGLNLYSLLFIP